MMLLANGRQKKLVLKLFTLSFLCAYEELLLIEKKKREILVNYYWGIDW